jgi:sugar/nucleoside kinase (ribokinase family)
MSTDVLITGTVAFDSIKTPYGEHQKLLGGSGLYSSFAASFLSPINLVSVVGDDFSADDLQLLNKKDINTDGVKILPGKKTFHWSGYYEYDMNQAHSLQTDLNVLTEFDPVLPESYKDSQYVFLANIDPELQLKVLAQINSPKLIAVDTMNFWIETKKAKLLEVIAKTNVLLINDAEIRQLMDTPNLLQAARGVIKTGCETVIIKKGEHGAMLVSGAYVFAVPAYPLEVVKDPTGAGDSFAGGVVSYLAANDDISEMTMRKAIVYGSALASFNVEDFSCERFKSLQQAEISRRLEEFRKLSSFEKLVF